MTQDEMIIHLSAETADYTMSRLALEILVGSEPTVNDSNKDTTKILGS